MMLYFANLVSALCHPVYNDLSIVSAAGQGIGMKSYMGPIGQMLKTPLLISLDPHFLVL